MTFELSLKRQVEIIQVAGIPDSTLSKGTGACTAHSMCAHGGKRGLGKCESWRYVSCRIRGEQVTEDHVRSNSGVNNRKNRSWYLLRIYYVAGTMLSTLEYSISLNLQQNTINPILQMMAMTIRGVTSLQQATQIVNGR